jgi:hypothetical protein
MTTAQNYIQIGTPITWRDAAASPAPTGGALQFSSLAQNALRVGARFDLGIYPRPIFLRFSCDLQWVATPTANRGAEFIFFPWDDDGTPGLDFGVVGAADATITATKRFNGRRAGSVRVEAAAVGPFRGGDLVQWPWRYISPAIYNDGAVALAAFATYQPTLTITPYYEVQIQ